MMISSPPVDALHALSALPFSVFVPPVNSEARLSAIPVPGAVRFGGRIKGPGGGGVRRREGVEDIPELVKHFFARCAEEGLPFRSLDRSGVDALMARDWPGNVRELENLVRRLAALGVKNIVSGDAVRAELGSAQALPVGDETLAEAVERHKDFASGLPAAGLYGGILRQMERPLVTLTLAAARGSQGRRDSGPRPQYAEKEDSRSRHRSDARKLT